MNLYARLLRLLVTSWRRRDLDTWATSVVRFRVQPTDLDSAGHMNNAKYLAVMDLGRVDLMLRSRLWQRTDAHGWFPVVSAQTIRYRRSLKPWQLFELRTRIIGFDERAMYVEQSFRVGEDVYAQAVVQQRYVRKTGGTVTAAELLEVTGPAPADREVPQWVLDWADGVRQGV